MTDARINVWRKTIASSPVKLCDVPLTNGSAGEIIKLAHHKVAHWKTSLIGIPPDISPTKYGYRSQSFATDSISDPLPVPPGTKVVPYKL